jgi:biopolymer transport protein ExbD
MRFTVSVKPFRGQLDVAAFMGVLMLVVVFLLLTRLVYTPGVRLQLPAAANLPGTERPTVEVAVDSSGRYYYQNQFIAGPDLLARLRRAATDAPEPLTLVVQADGRVSHAMLVELALLAREAGIHDALLATLPSPVAAGQP